MASYFPRGQQSFATIQTKFDGDCAGVTRNNARGIAFVTNQELTLSERKTLVDGTPGIEVEIYHLERITPILDRPEMKDVRLQFLRIGDSAEGNITLGGQGGSAPGAGGGGGGAIGDGAIAGDGGSGGQIISKLFRADELPDQVQILIGKGGDGGKDGRDGEHGGDTAFGNLLLAKGGIGGKGGLHKAARALTQQDVDSGVRVTSTYLAESVRIAEGLVFAMAAEWEFYRTGNLPAEVRLPLVCTIDISCLEQEDLVAFDVIARDPGGTTSTTQSIILRRAAGSAVCRPASVLCLVFTAITTGVWTITVETGGLILQTLRLELRAA